MILCKVALIHYIASHLGFIVFARATIYGVCCLLCACTSCTSFESLNNILPFKKKYAFKWIILTFKVALFCSNAYMKQIMNVNYNTHELKEDHRIKVYKRLIRFCKYQILLPNKLFVKMLTKSSKRPQTLKCNKNHSQSRFRLVTHISDLKCCNSLIETTMFYIVTTLNRSKKSYLFEPL